MTNQRHEDARRRAEMAEAAVQAEAAQAQKLIDEFVAEAGRRGIAPEPLQATTHHGQRLRTNLQGWYLRQNQSVAIGTDGGYYVLTLPVSAGLRERLRGVRVEPSPAPLVVGRGGRDGETGDLSEFLRWRLDAG